MITKHRIQSGNIVVSRIQCWVPMGAGGESVSQILYTVELSGVITEDCHDLRQPYDYTMIELEAESLTEIEAALAPHESLNQLTFKRLRELIATIKAAG